MVVTDGVKTLLTGPISWGKFKQGIGEFATRSCSSNWHSRAAGWSTFRQFVKCSSCGFELIKRAKAAEVTKDGYLRKCTLTVSFSFNWLFGQSNTNHGYFYFSSKSFSSSSNSKLFRKSIRNSIKSVYLLDNKNPDGGRRIQSVTKIGLISGGRLWSRAPGSLWTWSHALNSRKSIRFTLRN